MDFVTGIKAAKDGFIFVKGLREALRADRVEVLEVANRLMEIQELLLELQAALSDGLETNRKLNVQIQASEDQAAILADLDYVPDGGYFVRKSEKQRVAVPYCRLCWDVDGKLVHLANQNVDDYFWCDVHKINVRIPGWRRDG